MDFIHCHRSQDQGNGPQFETFSRDIHHCMCQQRNQCLRYIQQLLASTGCCKCSTSFPLAPSIWDLEYQYRPSPSSVELDEKMSSFSSTDLVVPAIVDEPGFVAETLWRPVYASNQPNEEEIMHDFHESTFPHMSCHPPSLDPAGQVFQSLNGHQPVLSPLEGSSTPPHLDAHVTFHDSLGALEDGSFLDIDNKAQSPSTTNQRVSTEDRKRRHYQIERNYRQRLNEKIKTLAEAIPGAEATGTCAGPGAYTMENSKAMVLERAVAYLTLLEDEYRQKRRALEERRKVAQSLHVLLDPAARRSDPYAEHHSMPSDLTDEWLALSNPNSPYAAPTSAHQP